MRHMTNQVSGISSNAMIVNTLSEVTSPSSSPATSEMKNH